MKARVLARMKVFEESQPEFTLIKLVIKFK